MWLTFLKHRGKLKQSLNCYCHEHKELQFVLDSVILSVEMWCIPDCVPKVWKFDGLKIKKISLQTISASTRSLYTEKHELQFWQPELTQGVCISSKWLIDFGGASIMLCVCVWKSVLNQCGNGVILLLGLNSTEWSSYRRCTINTAPTLNSFASISTPIYALML